MKILYSVILLFTLPFYCFTQNNKYQVVKEFSFDQMYGPIADKITYKDAEICGLIDIKDLEKKALIFNDDYDGIYLPGKGFAKVERRAKFGLLSLEGAEIVKPKYGQLLYNENSSLIGARKNNVWGFISKNGKTIISFKFEKIDAFIEDRAAVKLNGIWGFVDRGTNFFATIKNYTNLKSFSKGLAAASLNQKWGFINEDQQTIIPFKFEQVESFKNNGFAKVKLNGKWGVISTANQTVIPFKYEDIFIAESDFVFAKLNGKWGVIDKSENYLVNPLFDEVGGLENDFATVKMNGKWRLIKIGIASDIEDRRDVKKVLNPVENKEDYVLVWLTPDPDTKNLNTQTNPYPIKLRIKGGEYTKGDLSVFRNEEKVANKSGEASLRGTTFASSILLKKGKNEIYVKLKNSLSKKLTIFYNPDKPNLHLFAIGPDYSNSLDISNLNYTQNDALKVADKFQTQEGKIYSKVFVHKILGLDADATYISRTINLLDSDLIGPNDVLIIYISSHGSKEDFMGQPKFFIHGSTFDKASVITTSVYFESISSKLERLNCKKILFIDACHSGAAKGDMSTAINETVSKLLESQNGLAIFTSSSPEQYSYEIEKFKHGAFTKVFLDALEGHADTNGDRKLSLRELNAYLSKEVKRLVEKEIGKTQVPNISKNDLDLELPIFVY